MSCNIWVSDKEEKSMENGEVEFYSPQKIIVKLVLHRGPGYVSSSVYVQFMGL